MHKYDAKKKDLYFRVGEFDNGRKSNDTASADYGKVETGEDWSVALDEDVGGKYAAGTWGTASTLTIRGYLTETGSGVKTIYYKILNPSGTTDDEIKTQISTAASSFATNYASDNDGYFAPLPTTVQRRVIYTKKIDSDPEAVKVPSDSELSSMAYFKTTIPGFNAEKNYLLLVAVDNVGNAALDALGASKAEGVTTDVADADWNDGLAAFSLNVDTVAPTLTSATSGSQFTNGVSEITVSAGSDEEPAGTAASSGVKSVVLAIDGVSDSNVTALLFDGTEADSKK